MLKYKMQPSKLIIAIILMGLTTSIANTWRLEEDQNWDLIAADGHGKFLAEIAEIQKIINDGQTKTAQKAFEILEEDFSGLSGPDLDLFVKAELLLSKKKLNKSARTYDKLLTKYPDSLLVDATVKREFEIGMTYLNGRKQVILGLIKISGYAEGIRILEKVTDHAGYNSQIGIEASLAIVKNYEKREKYHEAYLKWWEIYEVGGIGILDRDALLGMAQAKHAIYNKNPESKKPFYDASCLLAARSYYEMLISSYPDYAEEIDVSQTLGVITEQLAHKELSTGLYYQQTGNHQSANLYFDMVISNWPESKSAEIARDMLNKNAGS